MLKRFPVKRTVPTGQIILLVVGMVIIFLSLIADLVGYGGSPDFAYRQLVAAMVGAIMTGVALLILKK